jgi:hypothetical protein
LFASLGLLSPTMRHQRHRAKGRSAIAVDIGPKGASSGGRGARAYVPSLSAVFLSADEGPFSCFFLVQQNCSGLNIKFCELTGAASRSEFEKSMRNLEKRPSKNLIVERGVEGRAEAVRATPQKHTATRLPPAGPPEAHAEILCRRRRRRNNG